MAREHRGGWVKDWTKRQSRLSAAAAMHSKSTPQIFTHLNWYIERKTADVLQTFHLILIFLKYECFCSKEEKDLVSEE